jgi:hypothetical protein
MWPATVCILSPFVVEFGMVERHTPAIQGARKIEQRGKHAGFYEEGGMFPLSCPGFGCYKVMAGH